MGRSGELKNEIQRPASFMPALGPALGRPSPIGQTMSGHRGAGRKKRDMNTPLLLTALVDAFSILVIFLLVQVTASQSPFDPSETIKLPQASSVDGDKKGDQSSVAVLNIENGRYILDGKAIERAMIAAALKQRKTAAGGEIRLVIQADESTDFDVMSPLFLSTAEAGVSKLEFAVQEVERTK